MVKNRLEVHGSCTAVVHTTVERHTLATDGERVGISTSMGEPGGSETGGVLIAVRRCHREAATGPLIEYLWRTWLESESKSKGSLYPCSITAAAAIHPDHRDAPTITARNTPRVVVGAGSGFTTPLSPLLSPPLRPGKHRHPPRLRHARSTPLHTAGVDHHLLRRNSGAP